MIIFRNCSTYFTLGTNAETNTFTTQLCEKQYELNGTEFNYFPRYPRTLKAYHDKKCAKIGHLIWNDTNQLQRTDMF